MTPYAVATIDGTTLTRQQILAMRILQDGKAYRSNRNEGRLLSWRTVDKLTAAGLALDVEGHVIATDAGKRLDLDTFEAALPPMRYDHGTHAAYTLDQCRCLPCKAAASDYEVARSRDNAYRRPRLVDAEPVRQHIRSLGASQKGGTDGVGLKQIAKVSGVAHGALWKIMYGAPDRNGPSERVRADTADKILAVTLAHMADGATVPAAPTVRRLDAMVAAGWVKARIARHVVGPQARSLQIGRRRVRVGTARAVARLHDAWRTGDIQLNEEPNRVLA